MVSCLLSGVVMNFGSSPSLPSPKLKTLASCLSTRILVSFGREEMNQN